MWSAIIVVLVLGPTVEGQPSIVQYRTGGTGGAFLAVEKKGMKWYAIALVGGICRI
jgi:hypothetical protein